MVEHDRIELAARDLAARRRAGPPRRQRRPADRAHGNVVSTRSRARATQDDQPVPARAQRRHMRVENALGAATAGAERRLGGEQDPHAK